MMRRAATAQVDDTDQPPPEGHNKPPLGEMLADSTRALAAEVDAIATRANEAPRKVVTQADLDKVASLVVDARSLTRRVKAAHQVEKAPFLEGGRIVDSFFAAYTDRLDRIVKAFQSAADDYQRARADEARKKAEEEAKRAREEQQRQADLAAKAAAANRPKAAEKHEERAELAAERASAVEFVSIAKPADLTRTRTASGVLASAKGVWTFEITEYGAVGLEVLRPYFKREHIEAALRLAVKQGVREVDGVRIFQDTKADLRR